MKEIRTKREKTQNFNVIQHIMYVLTSTTGTLKELFITCIFKNLQNVSIYNTNEIQILQIKRCGTKELRP